MTASKYFIYLKKEIHTVVAATTDGEGLPVTCAIDIMDADEDGLYFLTAKGKGFYDRLKQDGYMALTGIKGEDTLSCVAVSVRGKVCELGEAQLPRLFEKNPYMSEIYPTEKSRQALTAFKLYDGSGEWFDLSKKPIERVSFAFGKAKICEEGYFISEKCIGCGNCLKNCPQRCIKAEKPYRIRQNHCLHCGNCFAVCPVKAIEKRG